MTGQADTEDNPGIENLPPVTVDKFLGGRFVVEQPQIGRHRSGTDAILLAAAVPQNATGCLVDLGAGVGVAGMAAACRIPDLKVVLVERDPVMLALCRRSLKRSENDHIRGRITVLPADVTAKGSQRHAVGLTGASADHVILNPPYFEGSAVSPSPSDTKAGAHVLANSGLDPWIRTAADILKGGGTLTAIYRAGGLTDLLTAMSGRFGNITILPIISRKGQAASRIILQGQRDSRSELSIRAGLVMHEDNGNTYRQDVEALLRHGAALDLSAT